ncbi:MAG: hypothetical protein RLZZ347_505 [Candidatus Parcubacteria bacterium]|jgi:hypothetical protein
MKLDKVWKVVKQEALAAQQKMAKKLAEEMLGEVEADLIRLSRAGVDSGTDLRALEKALSNARTKLGSVEMGKGLLEKTVAQTLMAKMLALSTEVAKLELLRHQQIAKNFEAPKESPKKGKK